MELLLKRFASGEESTLGLIYKIDGSGLLFRCFGLEDQHNVPKVPGETRIPPGRYQIKLRDEGGMTQDYARRFPFHRGMLHLQDVPNFEWVYLHVGNFEHQTEGCILVGDGAIQNVTEIGQVTSSVAAYTRLYQEAVESMDGGEDVFITIEDFA